MEKRLLAQAERTGEAWPFGALTPGGYNVLMTDCGTKFRTWSAKGITSRSPETKYTTLTDDELMALPVGKLGSPNSRLFYWETGPRLAMGLHIPIIRAWGYEPQAMGFVWIKLNKSGDAKHFLHLRSSFWMGGGYTTRKNAEYVILAERGSPPERKSKSIRDLIFAPRREHSRKPDESFERIERYADGPYLELFSRTDRPGWTCWGDQAGKFTHERTSP